MGERLRSPEEMGLGLVERGIVKIMKGETEGRRNICLTSEGLELLSKDPSLQKEFLEIMAKHGIEPDENGFIEVVLNGEKKKICVKEEDFGTVKLEEGDEVIKSGM